jgi:putative hemolysin
MLHIISQAFKWIVILCIAATLTACSPAATAPQLSPTLPASTLAPQAATVPTTGDTSSQMANPASVNCTKVGGSLVIQKRGDGGE